MDEGREVRLGLACRKFGANKKPLNGEFREKIRFYHNSEEDFLVFSLF